MTTRPGYIWSGTEWVSIGQEAVVAPVSYQASAPSTPSTGDIWIDSNDDVPGIDTSQFLRWRKTAVGGETSVSGTDDNGLTLQYTPNYEQVYLNGVLLVRGQDYTATNGTSITGLTALAANDVVEVFGVVARVVGDVYTQAQTNSLLDAKSNVSTTGLVLITSATVGTSVTSVTINNCFSSTYDAYKIVGSGGAGSGSFAMNLQLGSSTSSYKGTLLYTQFGTATLNILTTSGDTKFNFPAVFTTDGISMNCDLINPFLTKKTTISAPYIDFGANGWFTGYHDVAASYTGFTLSFGGGTLTGGTIKVYGYK